MGNTPTPDSTWTDWVPLASSGATIGGSARYIQYQATLATSNLSQTPVLQAVTLEYTTGANTVAPKVLSESPAPGATGVGQLTPVVIKVSELMNAASITGATVYLAGNVAATVSYSGSTITLTPSVALAGNTTYTVTVSGSITDTSGNALGSNLTWSFTTGTGQWKQSTQADFNAGTQSGTTVASSGVQLAPFSDDFAGSALSSAWTSTPTGGGTSSVTVSNSILAVRATEVDSALTYTGVPVEGLINFGAAPYQHFGFATSLSSVGGNSWALFSTGGTTNTLFARVNANGTTTDVSLGALPAGFHDYLIKPVAGGFSFYVDGVLQTTINAALPSGTAMKVVLSDYNGSAQAPLQADWVRVYSYASTGTFTFTSAVFDATRVANWGTVNWDAILPAGTSITVQTSSSTDGQNWSAWAAVVNTGTVASPAGRYLRYRVILTTTDPTVTPTFQDITFTYT
jgi:hypothetical protein